MSTRAGDGNDVVPGTVVFYRPAGYLGQVTDVYEDDGQARVVLLSGRLGPAPFMVALEDLSVAEGQPWPP